MADWYDDEAEQDAHRDWLEDQQKQYMADLEALMGDVRFRRFMWQLLGKCRMFASNMTGNAWTQWQEGKREIGIQMTRDLHVNPDLYMKMWRENAQTEDFKPADKD